MERNLALRPAVGTGLILSVPLVMSIIDRYKSPGDGWHWSPSDFVLMGILIFCAGLTYELVARKLSNKTHRVILGVLVFFALAAIWVQLAVDGIIKLLTYLFG